MNQIKIGIISNISGIYPKMGRDYKDGLKLGFASVPKLKEVYDLELVLDIIQKTDHESIAGAIFKQINIDDVDVITGIVNQNVLSIQIENIRNKKIPFIINNLGECMPKDLVQSENLFGNSLNLWQSQWAMGKWAQEQYGGCPYVYYSIYDAGYQIASAFQMGALHAGAKSVECRMLQMQPNIIDTSALVEQIRLDQPTHAHVVLCGVDAKDFLKRLHESGLGKNIPVTVSPFMAEDGIMDDMAEYLSEFPNAITWSRYLDSEVNRKFESEFRQQHHRNANVFNLLGFETGLAIGQSIAELKGEEPTPAKLIERLGQLTLNGPRGRQVLNFQKQDFDVLLRVPGSTSDGYGNVIKEKLKSIKPSDPEIILAAKQNISGWQNPYLCI